MSTLKELSHRPGAGTLILIGGTSDAWRTTQAIDCAAIALAPSHKPIAFIPAAACPPDYGESFLETYMRFGAAGGYVVPVYRRASAHNAENARLLSDAGLIYFGGGETTALLEAMTDTPALDGVASAYEAGAVVVGMSAGAIALSAWGVPQDPNIGVLRGWGWLSRTIVSVHHTPARDTFLERALRERPGMMGLGLQEDVALSLGPDGATKTLGNRDPVIMPAGV